MSELDDLTKKLSEYAGRKDEHSLLPRVLLALVKSGSRSEQEIAKLADKLAKELEKLKSRQSMIWAGLIAGLILVMAILIILVILMIQR